MSLSSKISPKIGLITAVCLIAANMIGTGVYTSLGYQAMGTQSVLALLLLWVAGGVVALCGALTYAELAASMPKSGGEYRYLSNIYHPSVGFLSGWVSVTIGFAGPMAINAMAFGEYFSNIFNLAPDTLAVGLLILVVGINIISFSAGSNFQTLFTILNICMILGISVSGFILADHSHFHFSTTSGDVSQIFTASFAVSLVYVSYAYSGWNSATYIAEEIKDPAKNIPRALFIGTAAVMLLYLTVNFIFLYTVPLAELTANPKQIAFTSAQKIFDIGGAKIIAAIISVGLIASVNSMVITGPRVTKAIGEDFSFFKIFTSHNKKGSPVVAILLQFSIALILIITSKFDQVMTYIGFTLSLFTTLTVAGVFVYRYKNGHAIPKDTYKTWGYPVTPILFIMLEIWMMVFLLKNDPVPSLAGLATVLSGLVVYFIIKKK